MHKTNDSQVNGHGPQPESGLVPIRMVPLAQLRPTPENDKVYTPIDEEDPAFLDLVKDIKELGVKEPLVITEDFYILSGHRRYAACKLIGLSEVPCRIEGIRNGDPGFLRLLVAFNQQRVKSPDEAIREALVSASPRDAYRALLEHRQQVARVDIDLEAITIEGEKKRAQISKRKIPMLEAILQVLRDRLDFLPLTLRQIHYALLNNPPLKNTTKADSKYTNDQQSYKNLSDLLTRARIFECVPWDAIEDGTRPIVTWDCHRGLGAFVRGEVEDFLQNYFRDLQQGQPNHVEIIGEKNTVASIIRPVAAEFCIPYTLGRGYCSTPPRRMMQQRFLQSGKENLILLVMSDFDPEGEDIGHSFARSMRDDFGISNIKPIKVGLTQAQVESLELEPKLTAKEDSSRCKSFVEKHGNNVFELEAVEPHQLQVILREAILGVIDVDAFNREREQEAYEAARLQVMRQRIVNSIMREMDDN